MTAKEARRYVGNGLFILLLIFLLFYLLFPFYWAVVSSLKTPSELFQVPVNYVPEGVYFESYQNVFRNDDFARGLVNSTIVSFSVTALSLIFGSFAAYALGRLPFRGKTTILYTILAMTMFPTIAIVGSLFTFVRNPCVVFGGDCQEISMYNTRLALIVTYLVFTLPFTTWVLTNFFKSLPADLEQAALVDGATPFQTFYMVLLPLTIPAVVTTGMLAFIAAWNEFVFALTFTLDFNARTVQPAIAFFRGSSEREIPWGNIMAASVVVTIPLIILVLVFQRRIVDGLTAGAVKG
jgi:trehalose/maltose transport system permease protein